MAMKKMLPILLVVALSLARWVSASELAITIDDPNLAGSPGLHWRECNQAILSALSNPRKIQAALFVAGQKVPAPEGDELLATWSAEGHWIANHSFSHLYFPDVDFQAFRDDFLKGEARITKFPNFQRLFRFPFLKEGETVEKRDRMRAFLKKRHYRHGYVTIDASDWYISSRLEKRLAENPKADTTGYRDYYIRHILDRARYYQALVKLVTGRDIKHTLLLHYNLLNALYLKDLIKALQSNGWEIIDASQAFQDDIYKSLPDTLPAGESLVWSLAKATGKFEKILRYPAEDGAYEKAAMDELGL